MWHIAVSWNLDALVEPSASVDVSSNARLCLSKYGLGPAWLRDRRWRELETFVDESNVDRSVVAQIYGASDKLLYLFAAKDITRFADRVSPSDWLADLHVQRKDWIVRAKLRPQVDLFIQALEQQAVPQVLISAYSPEVTSLALSKLSPRARNALGTVLYQDDGRRPAPYSDTHRLARDVLLERIAGQHEPPLHPYIVAMEVHGNGIMAAHGGGMNVFQLVTPGEPIRDVPKDGPQVRAIRDLRVCAEIFVTLSGA